MTKINATLMKSAVLRMQKSKQNSKIKQKKIIEHAENGECSSSRFSWIFFQCYCSVEYQLQYCNIQCCNEEIWIIWTVFINIFIGNNLM